MKKRIFLAALAAAMLLTGCSLFNGNYVHVTAHDVGSSENLEEAVSADNYLQLRDILRSAVGSGKESTIIYVTDYEQSVLQRSMESAIRYAEHSDPIGDYAVEHITYEVGANAGRTAVAVSIEYRHNASELKKIRHLKDMTEVESAIREALESCEAKTVLLVDTYKSVDFTQMVQDLAQNAPDMVMEMPQVAEGIFGSGMARVLEITFTYETSRDSLRQMQTQVKPVFDSASLYVKGEDDENRKFAQLYAFLMERFEYQLDTSITPAYSLLRHGVGDSRAFAVVYAAMCRRADLECMTVTGTRNGEPWTWNLVRDGERYYHVDLLQCSEQGYFLERTDSEMNGYVWDFSAYPVCGPREVLPENGEKTEIEEN